MDNVFANGLEAATIAGLITGVGGFLIFLKKKYSQSDINFMLNIAAGVMLAAAFFSLLCPAMEQVVVFYDCIKQKAKLNIENPTE